MQKKLYFFLMLSINSVTPNPFEAQNFGLDANAGFNFPAGMDDFDPNAFYEQMSGSLGNIMQSPEGFEQFNQDIGEAIKGLVSDPELLKQNPELEQLKNNLDKDPDALRSYLENFRDVMADPNQAKELFSNFGNMLQETVSSENFLKELESDFSQDQELAALPLDEPKVTEAVKPNVMPELTRVEINGEWKPILLNRAAAQPERRAAVHMMVKDFNKAYKNLYLLTHAIDTEQQHLNQRTRKQMLDFFMEPGGLADYAAGIWTASNDEASAQFFLDQFSKDETFLEELVDFDFAVKELAKIAKLAAQDRLEEDQLFESGIIPKLFVGHEQELEARAQTSKDFAQRINKKLETEFIKNPNFLGLLKENRTNARQGNLPKTNSGTAKNKYPSDSNNNSYGSGSQYDNYYNQNSSDYNNPNMARSGSKNPDQSTSQGAQSTQAVNNRNIHSSDQKKEATAEEVKRNLIPQELEQLIGFLQELGSSSLENYQELCFKMEQFYNLLAKYSDKLDVLATILQKKPQKQKKELGGLVLTSKSTKQEPEPNNKNDDFFLQTFGQKKLSLALAGAVRAEKLLDTKCAIVPSAKILEANKGFKLLLQPPRPIFYFVGEEKTPPAVKTKFNEVATTQKFNQAADELAIVLIENRKFIRERHQDLQKIIAALNAAGATGQKNAEQDFDQSLHRLAHKIKFEITPPAADILTTLATTNFKNNAALTDKKFILGLSQCNKILETLIKIGINYKITTPFNGIEKVQAAAQHNLKLYTQTLKHFAEKTDSSSLFSTLLALKNGRITDAEVIKFYMSTEGKELLAEVGKILILYRQACLLWETPQAVDSQELLRLLQLSANFTPEQAEQILKELAKAEKNNGGYFAWLWQWIKSFWPF